MTILPQEKTSSTTKQPEDKEGRNLSEIGFQVGMLLEKFAERSRDVFWIRSADFKQIYISPAYESIWGRRREDLYSHPEYWEDFLHPEDLETVNKSIEKIKLDASEDQAVLTEFRILRPGGEIRWIRGESFALYDEKGNHLAYAGVAQDITKEKELQQAKELAKIANKSKSEFLANMSHDLRTPLNWLLGAADILKKRNTDPEKSKLLEMIVDGGQRILNMVEEILDYAKLESGKLPLYSEPVNLRQSLEEVVAMMANEANQKSLSLFVEYPANIAHHIFGDAQRIRRILMNLLGNAIKFTQQGYVRLAVTEQQSDDGALYIAIAVEDSGIGIPDNKLSFIFDRFEKVTPSSSSKYKGVGLGLAIVKKFVHAMHGEIKVTSSVDKGSCFTCLLPLVKTKEHEYQSPWHRLLAHLKVLFIDDLTLRAKAHAATLEIGNSTYCQSSAALTTLVTAQQQGQAFDIICIDEHIVDCSPLQLSRKISALLTTTEKPLLLLAQQAVLNTEMQSTSTQGFFAALTKPILPTELSKQFYQSWLTWRSQQLSAVELISELCPKILLVEDQPFGQKIVSMLLQEELGCQVDVAADASSAREKIAQQDYDLVLMDIGLPDQSGLELTKNIRAQEDHLEQLPIVALTAHVSEDMVAECKAAGMNDHLAKPAAAKDLLQVIKRHVLQNKELLHSHLQ